VTIGGPGFQALAGGGVAVTPSPHARCGMNWKPKAAAAVVLRKSCLFMMKAGWWIFYFRKIPILQVRDILQSGAGRYSFFKIWKKADKSRPGNETTRAQSPFW